MPLDTQYPIKETPPQRTDAETALEPMQVFRNGLKTATVSGLLMRMRCCYTDWETARAAEELLRRLDNDPIGEPDKDESLKVHRARLIPTQE